MSDASVFHFDAADATKIAAYRWPASEPVTAILQVSHDMGEHALRYRAPLQALRDAGVVIYANDHRGHGRTAARGTLGDFGLGGFASVVDDMAILTRLARHEHPGKSLILFVSLAHELSG